jgi:hypothetical protein
MPQKSLSVWFWFCEGLFFSNIDGAEILIKPFLFVIDFTGFLISAAD